MAGTGRSVSAGQSHFANVPGTTIERSKFNRSSGLKTAFDAGLLIPIYCDEALPGDTFNMKATLFGRLATPLKPVMDNMWLETFFFAVPNRLLWDNWEKFCGAQTDPGDSTSFVVPILGGTVLKESLYDYMGIPTDIGGLNFNALHPRAYSLIWDEWFRDENLQDSINPDTDDGPDVIADHTLKRRGKRHDYFTSCLPWPEKGGASPFTTVSPPAVNNPLAQVIRFSSTGGGFTDANVQVESTSGNVIVDTAPSGGGPHGVHWAAQTGLIVDNSSITINSLREAFQIQRLRERDARGGTRYTEIVRSHFGVVSSDQRLQRPEYLGGGSTQIQINTVQQTSETLAGTPQGNLAAYGTVAGGGHNFVKSFTEHCVIIGLACVRADLNYQQGLDRMWSRATRFDYYYPALSHLGEQAVTNKEIFAQGSGDPTADAAAFGYQERYAEYRYKPSKVTGIMRSNATPSLDTWHLSQDFSALPVLNDSFIQENPPIDRIIAVPSEPHLLLDCYFDLTCARPMPTYGVPGQADHF